MNAPGDVIEARAIAGVLGNKADNLVFVTSNKGGIGHLLGAAGAVETIAALLGMQKVNYHQTALIVYRCFQLIQVSDAHGMFASHY
jgi:3-oxoacyl-(acyl-carrier-protein) synthase